jgi:hypothetical protein
VTSIRVWHHRLSFAARSATAAGCWSLSLTARVKGTSSDDTLDYHLTRLLLHFRLSRIAHLDTLTVWSCSNRTAVVVFEHTPIHHCFYQKVTLRLAKSNTTLRQRTFHLLHNLSRQCFHHRPSTNPPGNGPSPSQLSPQHQCRPPHTSAHAPQLVLRSEH